MKIETMSKMSVRKVLKANELKANEEGRKDISDRLGYLAELVDEYGDWIAIKVSFHFTSREFEKMVIPYLRWKHDQHYIAIATFGENVAVYSVDNWYQTLGYIAREQILIPFPDKSVDEDEIVLYIVPMEMNYLLFREYKERIRRHKHDARQ